MSAMRGSSTNQITAAQLLQGHEFDGFVDLRDLLSAVGHVQGQFMAVPQPPEPEVSTTCSSEKGALFEGYISVPRWTSIEARPTTRLVL